MSRRPDTHRADATRAALRGAVTAGVLVLVAGCAAPAGTPTLSPTPTPASAPVPGPRPGASGHNDADVRFAQDMIPHLTQAEEVADVVLTKPGLSTELREVATGIQDRQGPEVARLRGWLKAWGATEAGEQDARSRAGVLTAQQLKNLHDADTLAAAKLYLEGMITHHEAAIALARDELAGGVSPEARELAQQVIDSRSAEIDGLRELLVGF